MRLNYLKISNSCIGFESNRIVTNYSIRFEISNIRTALEKSASQTEGWYVELEEVWMRKSRVA